MVSKFAGLIAIASFAISSVLAQAPTSNLVGGSCVSSYDANVDYFPNKMNTSGETAKYFTIEYHNNYKVVKNTYDNSTYVLYQCGTPAPTGLSNVNATFQVPITKAAVLETSVVPFIEMLGVSSSIDFVYDGSLICSPCFEKLLHAGSITELATTNKTLQAQQISQVQVQFGVEVFDPISNDTTSVSVAQTYEHDALSRSLWINFYAAFYNLESVANSATAAITENYKRLKESASHYSTKPVVAWTTYDAPSDYNNNTASYILSNAPYKVGLTSDAGATALNSSKTMFASSADLLAAIKDVDVLIDETYIGDNYTEFLQNYNISSSDESNYKFLKNKQVYREDGTLTSSGGYDWFEAPVAMADALLEDLINAVNPSALNSVYNRNWLRNIAHNEQIRITTESNCTWTADTARPDLATQYTGNDFSYSGSTSGANKISTSTTTMGVLAVSLAALAYLA